MVKNIVIFDCVAAFIKRPILWYISCILILRPSQHQILIILSLTLLIQSHQSILVFSEKTPLTIYSQRDISLCNSNAGHDGLAGVCSCVFLGNSLQLQGVTVAEHLVRKREDVCVCEREIAIAGPPIVQAAERWAHHCNESWRFEFNFIVKSFNRGIKLSGHRWVAVLLGSCN